MAGDGQDDDILSGRTFWIQRRSNGQWQNLECHDSGQTAVSRLGEIVTQTLKGEYRLLEAQISPLTGDTNYLQVIAIEDGRVIEPDDPDSGAEDSLPAGETLASPLEPAPEQPHRTEATSGSQLPGDLPPAFETSDKPPFRPLRGTDRPPLSAPSYRDLSRSAPRRRKSYGTVALSVLLLAAGLAIPSSNLPAPERIAQEAALLIDRFSAREDGFARAVERGDISTVMEALSRGADPNQRDAMDVPLLLRAAELREDAIVGALLLAGADPAALSHDRKTVLHHLAAGNHLDGLEMALKSGVKADTIGPLDRCETPLTAALTAGNGDAAALLMRYGATLKAQPGCSDSPLSIAAGRLLPEDPAPAPIVEPAPEKAEILASAAPVADKETAAPEPAPVAPAPQPLASVKPSVDPVTGTAPVAEESQTAPAAEIEVAAADPAAQPEVPETVAAAPAAPLQPTGQVRFTSTGVASTINAARHPRPPAKPAQPEVTVASAAAVLTAERYGRYFTNAIRKDDTESIEHLLRYLPADSNLSDLTADTGRLPPDSDPLLVDFALREGRFEIARLLIEAGLPHADAPLHDLVGADAGVHRGGAAAVLIGTGSDPDRLLEDMTPLMRAAREGDMLMAGALLDSGASLDLADPEGRKAMDFAVAANQTDMQELLVQRGSGFDYGELMFGLSWRSNLDDARNVADVCRDLPNGYTACRLKVTPWLNDVAAVIGQFDRQSGGRLVALQIDSELLTDPEIAQQRFEEAIREVEKRLPKDHSGFATRQMPDQGPFFDGLRPGVDRGSFSSYWSDDDRSRPVFVHLTLRGFKKDSGFYRILIGNPFRAG